MIEKDPSPLPTHFKGKDAIEHVAEAQAKGLASSTEIHGTETPGHISAGADSARETSILIALVWLVLKHLGVSALLSFQILVVFSLGWAIWKCGRSAWLAWFRLERMHRVIEQERWEILHHRKQEREELAELYQAKGFNGKLLEDVVDVLMADDERLLKVMVEEELCLNIGMLEHPLKQALGSLLGSLFSAVIIFLISWIFPVYGTWFGAAAMLAIAAISSARYEGNRIIPAICWNLGLGAMTIGTVFFLFDYIF